jgi:hypothetical protein
LDYDIFNRDNYYTSVRFCYSDQAAAFSAEEGGSSNPFKRIFEGNVVVGTKKLPIQYNCNGKITLLDNFFKADNLEHCVSFYKVDPNHYDVLDLNNTYIGFKVPVYVGAPGRIFKSRSNTIATPLTAEQFLRNMPPVPARTARTVFDVPLNAGIDQIQGIINAASALRKRAIVHFSRGDYRLTRTLVIPAGSDIQLQGDGFMTASVLVKAQAKEFEGDALVKVYGPTTVSMKELEFNMQYPENNCHAIVVYNADQNGSSVLLDQLYNDSDTSVLIKEYDNTLFQKTNAFFTTGNYISGGKLVQQGKGTMKMQSFCAQFANLTVLQNATFIARDCWWEGAAPVPINLTGSGNVTIDGGMMAPRKGDSSTIIAVNEFSGKISLMDMYLIGSIDIKKTNPGLQLLAWNINFYHKKRPLAFIKGGESYKGLFAGLSTQCFNNKDPECGMLITTNDKAVNVKDQDAFMDDMTKTLRNSRPVEYLQKPGGVSNFYLSRVTIDQRYKTGITFKK